MDDIIRIKCPFDGAVLSVKMQPGIERKSVTCPICKHRYPFTEFNPVQGYSGDGETDVATELPMINYSLGKLTVCETGDSYQLRMGSNVIGRMGQKSKADFQIDTGENRAMSREHIVVDVKRVPVKGIVHSVFLFKEKVNATYIGDDQLLYGDCVILNHGAMLKLPDATLMFEIPDEEETAY